MSVKGAVSAGHRLTAEAAVEILIDGGNAFDAVTAGMLVSCAVEPVLASPGGGGFLMARPSGKQVHLIDFFVDSPLAKKMPESLEFESIFADFGTAVQEFHIGKGAIANPGMIPGLFFINDHLGALPMVRLVEPAVNHAKAHRITAYQAQLAQIVKPILTHSSESRAIFAPEGELLKEGDTLQNPQLAETFEALAEDGIGLAIDGPLARAMLAGQDGEGFLGLADLKKYEVKDRDPLRFEFENSTLALNPEPSMGGPLIFNMFSRYQGEFSVVAIAETIRATDNLWRQSPTDFAALTGSQAVDGIAPNAIAQNGTTHISVIDSAGNAAAATMTNGSGCGIIAENCGFMMNNMLGEKDVLNCDFHNWRAGERLSSMMAPTLARKSDGTLFSLGSGGSSRIRTAIFQVLMRILKNGQRLTEAIEAPRIHVENGFVDCEFGFSDEELQSILAVFPEKHQVWEEISMYFGGVHAVSLDTKGNFSGFGDMRRDGIYLVAI